MRPIRALALAALALLSAAAPAADDHPLGRAEAVLESLAPLVESACGAKFAKPPRLVELSEADAAAVFAEDMRPEFERRYGTLTETQRGRLLQLAAATSVRSSLARYSFGLDAIVVTREGFDTQCAALEVTGERRAHLLTVTLAHECVHALDDARFDLGKLYRSARDDEALRAVAMVAEGRAVHFGRLAAARTAAPKDLVDLLPGGASPKNERAWHLHLTYRLGAQFVAALVERGGVALADEAVASPPVSTWSVCDPARWPDGRADARPAQVLGRAGMSETSAPLSNLQLLERYAAATDLGTAQALFATYTGGAQALVGGTNCAVLAFADEDAAKRYEELSRKEAPTARDGTLVARAMGDAQEERIAELTAALSEPAPEPR